MKSIQEIYTELKDKKFSFHRREEYEIYQDSLNHFMGKQYSVAASLAAVLYERIFTTRLIREESNPSGFVPSQKNVNEQLDNLLNAENDITNIQKMSFRKITKKLVDLGVLTSADKNTYDTFYTEKRNPVAHGLSLRVYIQSVGHKPKNIFELESDFYYENIAHELLYEIYQLMSTKKLLKSS